MASLDNRKINLRHLAKHPRDYYNSIHFNLLVGNFKYMIDQNEKLVRYNSKEYVCRRKRYYGRSPNFHFTFCFHIDELNAVNEICQSTNMALIHKHSSEEVNLFSRIKLMYFPKHIIPFDLNIKHDYVIENLEDAKKSIESFSKNTDIINFY